MQISIDQIVSEMVSKLSPALRQEFDERAGIIQFDGQLPRAHSECLAMLDVLNRHPEALSGK